jgi:anti-sigma B factor antagonist
LIHIAPLFRSNDARLCATYGRIDTTQQLFEVSTKWQENCPVIHLRGELDFGVLSTLSAELDTVLSKQPNELLLDVHELLFIDSEGVKVIVAAYERLGAWGGKFELYGARPAILRVFQILGFDQHFSLNP